MVMSRTYQLVCMIYASYLEVLLHIDPVIRLVTMDEMK